MLPTQLDVFAPPKTTRARPIADTSRDAQARNAPHCARQQQIVHLAIQSAGALGKTRAEVASLTGLPIQSVCARVDELLKSHAVRERAIESTRATPQYQRRAGGKILYDWSIRG